MTESELGRSLKRRKTDARKRIRSNLKLIFMFSFVVFFFLFFFFEERVGRRSKNTIFMFSLNIFINYLLH